MDQQELLSPCSVLLIEDDRALRELYQAALKAEGCTVTVVEDGVSALHILEVHRPEVIVVDLALPRPYSRSLARAFALAIRFDSFRMVWQFESRLAIPP